jgi:protein SCO1/2
MFLGLALAFLAGASGCAGTPTEKQYDVKGKVVAVDRQKPAVTLDHEDIPGLMKGMEMEFPVSDTRLLEGLRAGDQVQGRLKKTKDGYVITKLEKY